MRARGLIEEGFLESGRRNADGFFFVLVKLIPKRIRVGSAHRREPKKILV